MSHVMVVRLKCIKDMGVILVLLKSIPSLLTSLRVILALKKKEFEKGVIEEVMKKFVLQKG